MDMVTLDVVRQKKTQNTFKERVHQKKRVGAPERERHLHFPSWVPIVSNNFCILYDNKFAKFDFGVPRKNRETLREAKKHHGKVYLMANNPP